MDFFPFSLVLCPKMAQLGTIFGLFLLFLCFYVQKWLSLKLSLDFSCSFFAFMSRNCSAGNYLWTLLHFLAFESPKMANPIMYFGRFPFFIMIMSKAAPYSCNSRGRPSGSWKKVNFLLENSSIRTGSQRMSMASSSAFTCSTESTRNARWRSPAASG